MKKATTKLKNSLTSSDLLAIGNVMGGLLDKQSAVLRRDLASKKDLKDEISGLEVRLNKRMDEGFEGVLRGMDNLADRFVV